MMVPRFRVWRCRCSGRRVRPSRCRCRARAAADGPDVLGCGSGGHPTPAATTSRSRPLPRDGWEDAADRHHRTLAVSQENALALQRGQRGSGSRSSMNPTLRKALPQPGDADHASCTDLCTDHRSEEGRSHDTWLRRRIRGRGRGRLPRMACRPETTRDAGNLRRSAHNPATTGRSVTAEVTATTPHYGVAPL